ncbi:MAG: hypothetical protein U0521_02005 [Anaerolineae bacterium]
MSESQVLTALSAPGINTTPGELVIDIADGGVLYVPALTWSVPPVIERGAAPSLAAA